MMIRAESALTFIDAQDRQQWVEIGMALRDEHGDAAFEIFDKWSATANNYDPLAAKSAWKSFKRGGGIGIGTLFHIAKLAGWRPDAAYVPPTPEQLSEQKRQREIRESAEGKRIQAAQAVAARKAKWILGQCELDIHAYTGSKGFPDARVNVWRHKDSPPLLVVPMRYRNEIAGCQLIDVAGSKRFLSGQRSEEACFTIGQGGENYLVEGFATALSLHAILNTFRKQHTILATFSAGNMARIATIIPNAICICDHDQSQTGEKVGRESGRRWWMPPEVGMDVNDLHREMGLFRAAQVVKKGLMAL